MGLINVLAAALGGYVFGAIWYMALAKPWMQAAGIKMTADGKPDGNGSALPFILSAVAMVLVAGMMRHIFALSGIDTVGKGLVSGLGIGLFFIAPQIGVARHAKGVHAKNASPPKQLIDMRRNEVFDGHEVPRL